MQVRHTELVDLNLNLVMMICRELNFKTLGYLMLTNKHFFQMMTTTTNYFWSTRGISEPYRIFHFSVKFLRYPELIDAYCMNYLNYDDACLVLTVLRYDQELWRISLFGSAGLPLPEGGYRYDYVDSLRCPGVVIAEVEELVSAHQLLTSDVYKAILDHALGLAFLRGKFVPNNDFTDVSSTLKKLLNDILTPNGLTALNEKLITIEQLKPFTHRERRLRVLLSDEGIKALREKRITPEEAACTASKPLKLRLCQNAMNPHQLFAAGSARLSQDHEASRTALELSAVAPRRRRRS